MSRFTTTNYEILYLPVYNRGFIKFFSACSSLGHASLVSLLKLLLFWTTPPAAPTNSL